ncbi:hypothetical protein AA11826_2024 [Komagataeibacter oboediens DSM 11826]|uniref:Uncharacterized protein n=1 Tax=Komagataeibacter oboediens TaxID=65958 RepID=A0A318R199_9PROT|nr:hypothetical protein [Komagataeibacter oboediens]PYD79383.1 hypothetical protein CFR80_15175 [Komagataeibacter oboediens]GBR39946.1 hypothetical protein AA11826_2024 [Komagataeibacter oboediens DSM 11826]
MTQGIRDPIKHRRYAAKRKAELTARGYRYQTLALAEDVVNCLEQIKENRGFTNKADAVNWIIRQAMHSNILKDQAVKQA